MKKNLTYSWFDKPGRNFHRFNLTMKILILLFFCGILNVMAVPSISLSTESTLNFKNSDARDPIESGVDPEQQRSVSGTVTDAATGQSMPGVNILVKGTTIGALTDANGKFTLMVSDPNNAILVFSFIGYGTREIPVLGKSVVDLALNAEITGLEEVVVIGYGSVKKKDLTGSVGSIGTEALKEVVVNRIDDALSGKLAGVQVKTVSGEPGAAPQIRIRGIGSISAGVDPLYVVDGFPVSSADIRMLNSNDIETIDILKDASATAIYGSRGSNGVILISTKRGSSGKTIFTFDTHFGLQKALKVPKYMNAMEQANYFYDGVRDRNIDGGYNVSGDPTTWHYAVPSQVMDVIQGRNTTDIEWLDEVLRTAPQQQYQLTATGGNESIKFALSGAYLNQDGIIINSNFKRFTLRSNIDARLSKRLTLKVNLSPSFADENNVNSSGNYSNENIIGYASSINPWLPVFDANGNYTVMNGIPDGGSFDNAVADAREIYNHQKSFSIMGNINAEYTILDELKLNIMLGVSSLNSHREKFKPQTPEMLNTLAYGEDRTSLAYNWATEYTLNYNKSILKHNLTGLIGFTAQKDIYGSNYLMSNQYPNNLVPDLSAVGGVITTGTASNGAWSLVSYLARVNYNYNSKYYLTASVRTDGSSRFGSANLYGFFPSAALAWRISDESFFKNVRFLSELKLRTSFGVTGNNNIGDYAKYATITYENYAVGGVSAAGFGQGAIANANLTWEKQKQFNTGVDISFFKSRLSLIVDYFYSINSNLLLNVNIPSVTGFQTALQNIGKVKNVGWEFVANTRNLTGKFGWSTDFNISTYRNEVLKLGSEGDPIYNGANVTQIGKPIGMYYGWLFDGIFMTQAELDKGPIFAPGTATATRLGDVRWKDISGPDGKPDGVINSLDKTIMGNPYPDFYYGMTNRFSYKNFTLAVNLQGSQGNEILNLIRIASFGRARTKQFSYSNNYWKSEADPGDGGKFSYRPDDAPTGNLRGDASQLEVFDGSYLRINNISLNYLLPDKISQRLMLESLRLYINVTNPFVFTKYPFWNPEISDSNNALEPGRDNNGYPVTKTFLIGLNLSF